MRGPTERSGTSLSRRDFVTGVVSSIGAGGLQFPFPASASSPFAWHSLKIGAGGFITGLSIADDETLVVRTDTYGAWKWNGDSSNSWRTWASVPRRGSSMKIFLRGPSLRSKITESQEADTTSSEYFCKHMPRK